MLKKPLVRRLYQIDNTVYFVFCTKHTQDIINMQFIFCKRKRADEFFFVCSIITNRSVCCRKTRNTIARYICCDRKKTTVTAAVAAIRISCLKTFVTAESDVVNTSAKFNRKNKTKNRNSRGAWIIILKIKNYDKCETYFFVYIFAFFYSIIYTI